MKIKIAKIQYDRLRTNESTFVAIFTTDIAEKYNNNAMHLGKSYCELTPTE